MTMHFKMTNAFRLTLSSSGSLSAVTYTPVLCCTNDSMIMNDFGWHVGDQWLLFLIKGLVKKVGWALPKCLLAFFFNSINSKSSIKHTVSAASFLSVDQVSGISGFVSFGHAKLNGYMASRPGKHAQMECIWGGYLSSDDQTSAGSGHAVVISTCVLRQNMRWI